MTSEDLSAVIFSSDADSPRASELGKRLGVPARSRSNSCAPGLSLLVDELGLALVELGSKENRRPLRLDFESDAKNFLGSRSGLRSSQLIRAVCTKANQKVSVVDATGGLGGDALMLACAGCQVTVCERIPVLSVLLKDAVERLLRSDLRHVGENLAVVEGDAQETLQVMSEPPEVVYLDPMFPKRKGAALVKREMRLVRSVAGDDTDSENLFLTACEVATKRVIVKRMRGNPTISALEPHHSLKGKSNRFDVYCL